MFRSLILCVLTLCATASPALAQPDARAPDTATLEFANKPWTGDLDGMKERRLIRALVPYSRTFYFVDGGTERGVSHEYMRKFEDTINARAKAGHIRIHVVIIPTTRDRLIPALREGLGDVVVTNLTVTDERKALVDFTSPVARKVAEVVVGHVDAPAPRSLDDLAGKPVFVRPGSSYHEHLKALNVDLVARGLAPVEIVEAPPEFEDEDVLEMVNAGLVQYSVVDRYIGEQWRKILPDLRLHDDVVLRDGNEIAFAIRQNSPQLKAALDAFLAETRRGTTFGNITYRRYFEGTRFAGNATAKAEIAKLNQLIELFRKYGEQYRVDWLLMAAQGYQESRLDHSVRSPVGAIGVMQVMPATGGDMKVGDITELENNIHAGVKYMRFVIDNFFDDPAVDPINRMLFAFASYNAGPGRVRGLRRTAAERGLDPNIWFNNVEHIAAEKIGRETVQYVANIYKYYTAYRLVMAEDQRRAELKAKARAAADGGGTRGPSTDGSD